MVYDFEVIKIIWHHNRGSFILARHLGEKHDFDVPDNALFDDVPVYRYIEFFPVGEDGTYSDKFAFLPMSLGKLPDGYFEEGQRVKLVTG